MGEHVRKFTVDNQGIADFIEMLKHALNLNEDDEFETVYNLNYITISKTGKRCFLCGSDKDLSFLGNGRNACRTCLRAMSRALKE